MTSVMLRDIASRVVPKELQSKVNFDRVQEVEMKKPESTNSGLKNKTGDLVDKPQLNGTNYTPIVADPPNFRKEIGVSVSEEGFIKLPRSLLKSEVWKSLRLRQQKLFLYILEKAQYNHYVFKYNGKDIPLAPGDLCNSYRGLAEDFNQTVKYRDEKIDAPFVQRAVSTFSKSGLTDTRTDTGRLVISIIYPGIYDDLRKETDTPTDTATIQQRYTNEERKKVRSIKETIDGANALDSSLLNNEKEEQKKGPSVFKPQSKPKDLSPEKEKQYHALWKFVVEKGMDDGHTPNQKKGIIEKDITGWLATYEASTILECLKLTLKAVPKSTWPGYMATILKKNVIAKKDNIQINNEFLYEIMKTHPCSHLSDTKQYVTDKVRHADYQKNIEPSAFKEMIMKSIEIAENYQDKPENHNAESDYDDDY